jgi:hypothetical protein
MSNRFYLFIVLSVFVIACALRIGLAYVNNGSANDNHFEVCYKIRMEHRLPVRGECFECYQPKLYHCCVAAIWEMEDSLPDGFLMNHFIPAQMLNAVAGIGTIVIVWLFLNDLMIGVWPKVLSFSLIALNTKLIGINAQITNDTFSIFFTTAALYFLYQYFQRSTVLNFALLLLSAVLSGLSKGSALVFFIGVVFVSVLRMLVFGKSSLNLYKAYLVPLLIFTGVFLISVETIGQYFPDNSKNVLYQINIEKSPFPPFFGTDNYRERLGVTSLSNSFFTFRFIDLLIHPKISNGQDAFPWHRTSFWTQLYGRAHFVYFDNWPFGFWQTDDPVVLTMGRIIFVLALFPTGLLLRGVYQRVRFWWISLRKGKWDFVVKESLWIFDIFLAGYIIALIVFSISYRSFVSMKVIYIYPAILCAALLIGQQLERFNTEVRNKGIRLLANLSLAVLLALYVMVTMHLIYSGYTYHA